MKNILIGIQPTGKLHLGHYLGIIKEGLRLQASPKNNVLWLVAGLHSLTSGYKFFEIMNKENELFNELEQLGAINIMKQSENIHTCIMLWELSCVTSIKQLEKMTQFKQKKDKLNNAGLLLYPLLQTADIIYSGFRYILVGEDQKEHLEFANRILKKIKKRPVEPIFSKTPKIMSLTNSSKKMSNSEPKGCLFLSDTKEEKTKKIIKAVMDEKGIENLRLIAKEYGVKYSKNHKKFKEALAKKLCE